MRIAAATAALGLFLLVSPAHATGADDRWSNQSPETRLWFDRAELTPAAADRLGFLGCCKTSDVVHTQFRVDQKNGEDQWWWLDGAEWKRIPPDIIHWGESAPDKQPTLFLLSEDFNGSPAGTPTCFWPGESGN